MGLRPLEILYYFQWGDRLYKSGSDYYTDRILTYKDVPPRCIERVIIDLQYIGHYRTFIGTCEV